MSDERPRYQLLADSFFAPYLVAKGSIITWDGPPHQFLEPINAAARDKMEEFYNQDFTFRVKDPDGGEDLVRTHRPRADLRLAASGEAAPVHTMEVLAGPPKSSVGELTLATVGLEKSTSAIPPPSTPQSVPEEWREKTKVASVETDSGDVLAIVAAAPVDKTIPGATVTTSRRGG